MRLKEKVKNFKQKFKEDKEFRKDCINNTIIGATVTGSCALCGMIWYSIGNKAGYTKGYAKGYNDDHELRQKCFNFGRSIGQSEAFELLYNDAVDYGKVRIHNSEHSNSGVDIIVKEIKEFTE